MKIQRLSLVCFAAAFAAGRAAAQELHLNEIYASHQFSDDREFIELIGTPGMSLDGYMVLMIDGESPVTDGLLDRAWDLSGLTVPQDGFFVLGDTITANVDFVMATDNILENGTETFYLVQTTDPAYFTNNLGVHMDPDGDLVTLIAAHAPTTIVDSVAMVDTDYPTTDFVYDNAPVVGPDGPFFPAGILRGGDYPNAWCPDTFLDFSVDDNLDLPRTPGEPNVDCSGGSSTVIGSTYCSPATLNSSGGPAFITATGSDLVSDNSVRLRATSLPAGRFGFFLGSRAQASIMNPGGSQGTLCLGVPFAPFAAQVQNSGLDGAMEIDVDLTAIPGTGAVLMGDTWNFQAWFRDVNPQNTSNFSNAVSITFM